MLSDPKLQGLEFKKAIIELLEHERHVALDVTPQAGTSHAERLSFVLDVLKDKTDIQSLEIWQESSNYYYHFDPEVYKAVEGTSQHNPGMKVLSVQVNMTDDYWGDSGISQLSKLTELHLNTDVDGRTMQLLRQASNLERLVLRSSQGRLGKEEIEILASLPEFKYLEGTGCFRRSCKEPLQELMETLKTRAAS